MNQEKNVRNWWFYRALRIAAAIMTLMASLAIALMAVTALMDDTEILADFMDCDTKIGNLNIAAKTGIVAVTLFALLTFWRLFRSINRFLKYAQKRELFLDSAEEALARMGRAMIMLYFVFLSFDILIPMLVTPQEVYENSVDFIGAFVDLNVLTLLIGIVLIALSGALREGRAAQDELKQIV